MPGVKRDFYGVCPVCWSVRIKHRVFKNPRYKCEKCGSEFPNKKRISHANRILFNNLLKNARNISFPNTDPYVRGLVVKAIKERLDHA